MVPRCLAPARPSILYCAPLCRMFFFKSMAATQSGCSVLLTLMFKSMHISIFGNEHAYVLCFLCFLLFVRVLSFLLFLELVIVYVVSVC